MTLSRADLEILKIECLTEGVHISPAAHSYLSSNGTVPLSVHEYPTTAGVTLELPMNVYVNAPFGPDARNPSCLLDFQVGKGLFLRNQTGEVEVRRFLRLPGYLGKKDSQGRPLTAVAMSHGDRLRLSPLLGCAYDCGFCDLPAAPYLLRSADQLIGAMAIAKNDTQLPIRHVLISGGSPRKAHYDLFEEICVAVASAAEMPVDVMLSPMIRNGDYLKRLVDAGVTGFAINLELNSTNAALEILGRKYRTTRAVFAETVSDAVGLLGSTGAVRSLIIPGLESIDETLAGVEFLAALGCHPVLSPFRPAPGTRLQRQEAPSSSDLITILSGARAICQHYGVNLGPECLQCQHNTLAFPWDSPRDA